MLQNTKATKKTYALKQMADFKAKIIENKFSGLHLEIDQTDVYFKMVDWDKQSNDLPDNIDQFDWRNFQQEYRDYIDLVKMAQLIPVIGAPVGIVVNYRLIKKLGATAINAYRMRLLK